MEERGVYIYNDEERIQDFLGKINGVLTQAENCIAVNSLG